MPTWGEILQEGTEYFLKTQQSPFDYLRRKYLKQLSDYTKRDTILYATAWTQIRDTPSALLSINEEDIQGFMEVVHGLEGENLDVVIHSPGGIAETTEAILTYLRCKFKNIRVIIPNVAMSAATMLACGSDQIVMGTHSFIGPIDPQMQIRGRNGMVQSVAAHAIREQFEMAKEECKKEPKNIGVWLPIIEQYGPALLKQCELATQLSQELVAKWLKQYMFAGEKDSDKKADFIASTLANHANFKSHGRHISVQQATEMGLKILPLENDQNLQDLVLSVFHATTQTFEGSRAVKIVENHKGRAFIKQHGQIIVKQAPPGMIMPFQRPSIIPTPALTPQPPAVPSTVPPVKPQNDKIDSGQS